MKLAGASLTRALTDPDKGTRLYLFYGPDEAGSRALADRLQTSLGAEKFALAGASIKSDPASLADEAGALALFGGPRLIWVEPAGDEIATAVEALLETPSVESAVVAIAGPLRKTSALVKLAEGHARAAAVISYLPEGRDAARLVVDLGRREGLRIDIDVAERVTAGCGGNQAVIAQELVKFALYLGASEKAPKVLGHDTLDAVGAESGEGNAGRIVDAALTGAMADVFEELDRAGFSPSEAIPVVRALQRRLLQLAPMLARTADGESADAVMASAGKALFWKDKPIIGKLLRTWRSERLAELVERSAMLERAMILAGAPPLPALGEELTTVARAAARRR